METTRVDNFELIKPLLDFSKPNTFYFIQILKRRKENPDMKNGVQVKDNFYLYTEDDLENIKHKIVESCTIHNARAYINVNRLDLENIALHVSKKVIDLIIQGDYKAIKNAYPAVCGSHTSESNKRWIIDIDTIDGHDYTLIRAMIGMLHAEAKSNYSIVAELPTKNGRHIIANPFNMKKFADRFPTIDVHKNSPTILYIP